MRLLDLGHLQQVDNSVLETAVSVLESDETKRWLSINCEDANASVSKFKRRFKSTQDKPFLTYTYKRLKW